jgi:hypothetical protein
MAAPDISAGDRLINPVPERAPSKGQNKIIRVDGTETSLHGKLSLDEIQLIIGCDGLDTVIIDRRKQTVMFVDDVGMIDGKPVNPKATELYLGVSKPDNPHSIHGDVVIVPAGGLARARITTSSRSPGKWRCRKG